MTKGNRNRCLVKSQMPSGGETSRGGRISGSRACGEMTQEQWDEKMISSCKREYDRRIYSDGNWIRHITNVDSQQACAEEAAKTDGAKNWVYNWQAKSCYVKDDQGTRGDEPGKVLGNIECGFLSQDQWDQMMAEDCLWEPRLALHGTFNDSRDGQNVRVENREACARLATEIEGGLFWTFKQTTGWCGVRGSNEETSSWLHWDSGNRKCGFLSQGQWDQVMIKKCKRVPGIDIGTVENGDVVEEVEDEKRCAELASNSPDGLVWAFNEEGALCHVKMTDEQKIPSDGWVTGNRECGLLDVKQWNQLLAEPNTLSPEIRQSLGIYLDSPGKVDCQQIQEQTGELDGRDSLPTIDLFLNPNRSEELESIVKFVINKEDNMTQSKVSGVAYAMSQCCRRSFLEHTKTISASSGTQPFPASPPRRNQTLPTC